MENSKTKECIFRKGYSEIERLRQDGYIQLCKDGFFEARHQPRIYREPGLLRSGHFSLEGRTRPDDFSWDLETSMIILTPSKLSQWLGAHSLHGAQNEPSGSLHVEMYDPAYLEEQPRVEDADIIYSV